MKSTPVVSDFLSSETFDQLSAKKQAWIEGLLDEIHEGNEAEVDIHLEAFEDEDYALPTSDEMAPFSLDVSDDDEAEQTDDDDEEDFSVGVNTWN